MNLTVLICTHNRADLLERVLASINAAIRPAMPVQILVAANACTDDTVARMQAYHAHQPGSDRLPLRVIEVPTPGKSHALNQAIPLIDTELTAFVDDDHRVDANYLVAIEHAANTWPDAGLYCGRILPDWDGTEPGWVHDTGPYGIYPLPVPRYDQGDDHREIDDAGPLPGGGNLFLPTPLLTRVGTFATDYGPVGHNLGGAEDLEWIRRALATGARLRYVPEAIQYHYVDADRLQLGYLMRKAFERSASTIRLRHRVEKIPLFTYRKAAGYLVQSILSLSWRRRRFYLVRLAAALGEVKGFRQVAAEFRADRAGNPS
jgi:glycosyltransferase involved in cell wall biosynthesis